ncbi:MAG: hypothetical protein IPK22_25365 [Verrucomicrobiaceae bacterium]|nr:hypothetical protein [Verrucomicrobiaceae bacterium]
MKSMLYIVRHVAALGIAAVLGAVLWTIVYFALLLFAMFTDSGIGSPISYPLWLVFLLLSITIIGLLIFAPACAVGRLFVAITRFPQIASIPVVFGVGALLSYLAYGLYIATVTTHSMPPATTVFLNYCIYLSIPLGAYWWIVDGPFAVVDGLRRWLHQRFSAATRPSADTPA